MTRKTYLCRYSIFAEELTQRPIAECAAAFAEADAWFSAWQGGDVQPDEMLIIADQVLVQWQPKTLCDVCCQDTLAPAFACG